MLRHAALALVLSGCATTAPARLQPPAPLVFFTGCWHASAEDPSTKQRFTLRYCVEPALAGAFSFGRGVSTELGLEVHDVWGVDALTGEVTRTLFDSNGTQGQVRSKGWDGDTLVLEGEGRGRDGATRVRETIVRSGPDAFRATWEAFVDGRWAAYSVETLTREGR